MRTHPRVCRLLTVIGLAAAAPASAQTLRGTLLDRDTDQPIATARVVLLTEAGDSVASALTNGNGAFLLRGTEPGGYLLAASALGYDDGLAGIFDFEPGGEMSVEFRLRPTPLLLEGIEVTATIQEGALIRNGFYERLTSGLGTFLTPAAIGKSDALKASELLWGIPGVNIVPGMFGNVITMRAPLGDCTPGIWMDGAPMVGAQLDDLIGTTSTIEAIEVYRGAAELPLQWSGTQAGGCGAIVIWTKGR